MNLLVEGRGLALVRGGRLLFDRLDVVLGAGEGLHLTGPNGCGKSSLIRLIARLLTPAAGAIDRQEAALADDNLALDREAPLGKALAYWRGSRIAEAMAAFDLQPLADIPVRMLSTGQARRARLTRVMASGAPLWLLDEPLNGLDIASVARLDQVIANHRAAGGGVIIASHAPLAGQWRTLELAQ